MKNANIKQKKCKQQFDYWTYIEWTIESVKYFF